eukprot:COSAG05_NODE_153_length_15894_cov_27.910415_4_plen_93_part_00
MLYGKLQRKFENIRLWRAEIHRAREAGEVAQHSLLRMIRCALMLGTFGCVSCFWKKYAITPLPLYLSRMPLAYKRRIYDACAINRPFQTMHD